MNLEWMELTPDCPCQMCSCLWNCPFGLGEGWSLGSVSWSCKKCCTLQDCSAVFCLAQCVYVMYVTLALQRREVQDNGRRDGGIFTMLSGVVRSSSDKRCRQPAHSSPMIHLLHSHLQQCMSENGSVWAHWQHWSCVHELRITVHLLPGAAL